MRSTAVMFACAAALAVATPAAAKARHSKIHKDTHPAVTQFCGDRYCPTPSPGRADAGTALVAGASDRFGSHRGSRQERKASRRPPLSFLGDLLPAGSYRVHYPRANRRLVSLINSKLDRWVRPTGGCSGGVEWLATQYGRESGPRTASGERFRPGAHTAAHNTLPFGTVLRVWMPGGGRSVAVRITDRGPATKADIDLSTGSAAAIGMRSSAYVCVSKGA